MFMFGNLYALIMDCGRLESWSSTDIREPQKVSPGRRRRRNESKSMKTVQCQESSKEPYNVQRCCRSRESESAAISKVMSATKNGLLMYDRHGTTSGITGNNTKITNRQFDFWQNTNRTATSTLTTTLAATVQ